jgi:uncharacterized protein YyaL (SSP411 family)
VAADFAIGPAYEVVIAGDSRSDDVKAMLQALKSRFIPNKVIILRPLDQVSPGIDRISDFVKSYGSPDGKATAYVCRDRNCQLPTSDIGKMLGMLDD